MSGIFQGKERRKNELILKSLISGAKTTNQIAEYIYLNPEKGIKPSTVNRNKVKTEVSMISRKGSRLEELKTKGYITHKDSLWDLTFKGLGVALTLFDNLRPIYPQVKSFLHSFVREFKKQISKNPTLPAFFKSSKFIQPIKLFESRNFIQLLKDLTNEQMRLGLDFDQINEENFLATLFGRILQTYFSKMFEP